MKKFGKLAAGLLTAIMITALFTTAHAQSAAPGTVKVESSLNVRSGSGISYPVTGSLKSGDTVTILGSASGWYNISFGGKTGWVSGHYLTANATVHVSGSLNVRSYGSTAAAVVGYLYDGTLVTVTDLSPTGFYKISYSGGTGWVSSRYLTLGKTYFASGSAQTVIDAALRMVGAPYVFGGTTASGFDCSGLTRYAYAQAGVSLPHSSSQQAAMGTYVSRSSLKPGDLIFFDTDGGNNNITHEGIYLGNGQFINAESGMVMRVNICSLDNSYWSSVYMTARRILS